MDYTYRVMQRTETEEVFCVKTFDSMTKAHNWIVDNEKDYPESRFFIEKVN